MGILFKIIFNLLNFLCSLPDKMLSRRTKKATGDGDVPGDVLKLLGEDNLKHD